MRLSKLSIYGFKSFLRRTEIVLPGNITAIVGPNGSGKSNIADAVRWVLGEQSAKTLRGNSMQDVIFNGTTQRRAMNFCEVSLCFDNSDGRLPLPYQEVTILRRVYRNGDSEYQLNGSACRLKDIVDLLRDTGVGREGYSIIGQGRIDEILSQRSEDRRTVFEEAAGISRFRSRKEEAEARLKKADENLTRVEDVLEELTKLLIPLKSEADAAREYLRLTGLLKSVDLRLYLVTMERLEGREANALQLSESLAEGVHRLEAEIETASGERDALDGKVSGLQQKLSAAHDALLAKKDALFSAKENQNGLQGRIQSLEEEAQRNQTEDTSLKTRMRLMEATIAQSETGLAAAKAHVEKTQAELEKRRQRLTEAGQRVDGLQARMEEHNQLLMERMSRLQDVKTALARQTTMKTSLENRREELVQQLTRGREDTEALQAALTNLQENLKAGQTRLDALREEARELEAASSRLLSQILEGQKQQHTGQQALSEASARLKTLKELQQGYEGYQYPVKGALQYAARKGIQGVRGVVARLIRVPKEYETAIDMALGGAMQHIVTDTQQEAKALIEYLRENHLGRATFLPIRTVKGRTLNPQERQVLSMEGCLGVASELIGFDPEYRGIMESLLGRTIIARDLNCGIPMMEKTGHTLRLVTLQGDIINAGGSMTGGSVTQKSGNLLGREREISELKLKVEQLSTQDQELTKKLAAWEEERLGSKQQRESNAGALRQMEITVARDSEHVSSAEKELSAHQGRVKTLENAAAQIEDSLADIEEEIQRLQQQSSETDVDNGDLQQITQELSKALDQARREREAAQDEVTDAMLLVQSAENDAETFRRDRSRISDDMNNCRLLQQQLEKRMQDNQTRKQETLTQLEEAKQTITRREEELSSASASVEETDHYLQAAQEELRNMQGVLEANNALLLKESTKLHNQEAQLAKVRSEKETLGDRLWHSWELRHEGAVEAVEAETGGSDWRSDFDEDSVKAQAEQYRGDIRRMGEVNTSALEEYTKMAEHHRELSDQQADLMKAKKDLEELIEDLLSKMETVFVSRFGELQVYFSECFSRLFGGGYGELCLSDPTDPLNCGIEIIVQPPGKKRQILSLFSGGERALTAIAILFAMLRLKPTPFCILDEIEAALDDANIATYADYLREFSESTQFIVITHRKGTMERADTLFGVAMQEKGVSSLVSVNLTDWEE